MPNRKKVIQRRFALSIRYLREIPEDAEHSIRQAEQRFRSHRPNVIGMKSEPAFAILGIHVRHPSGSAFGLDRNAQCGPVHLDPGT